MKFKSILILIIVFILPSSLFSLNRVWGAETVGASQSFQKMKTLLFQLRTSSSENSEKRSYGTAFVIRRGGYLATNYHVVADSIWNKTSEKIFLEVDKISIPARIIVVDVLNDLAVIKVDKTFSDEISISESEPTQGDTLFSLGLPQDLNWTVITGTFNGYIKQGLLKQIHLTTPLNSGMSGGPTVNTNNQLVGINVSVNTTGQQISFAVPVAHLKELIQRLKTREIASNEDPIKTQKMDIHKQLIASQKKLTEEIIGQMDNHKKQNGWNVSKFGELTKCWGHEVPTNETNFPTFIEDCNVGQATRVSDALYTTHFQSRNIFLTNKTLNSFKFHHAINSYWSSPVYGLSRRFDRNSSINKGPQDCFSSPVKRKGFSITAEICLQAFIPYTDLFEAEIKLARKSPSGEKGMISEITLSGFTKESIHTLASKFLQNTGDESK